MSKRMLVNAAQEGEVRVATVENSVLEDLNIATDANELLKGNLYKGIVVSVESGLQAALSTTGVNVTGLSRLTIFIVATTIRRRRTTASDSVSRMQSLRVPNSSYRSTKRRSATKVPLSPPTSHYRVDTLF